MGFVMGVFNPNEEQFRWLSVDCMPRFRPGEEKPYQVCSVFTDITEIKQVETALKQAKEKAEEADKLKSAFLATMSHGESVQHTKYSILTCILTFLSMLDRDTNAFKWHHGSSRSHPFEQFGGVIQRGELRRSSSGATEWQIVNIDY